MRCFFVNFSGGAMPASCCIVSLVLTANDKIVPDSLTVAWFAAWTAELALLVNIKIKGKDD